MADCVMDLYLLCSAMLCVEWQLDKKSKGFCVALYFGKNSVKTQNTGKQTIIQISGMAKPS